MSISATNACATSNGLGKRKAILYKWAAIDQTIKNITKTKIGGIKFFISFPSTFQIYH
jgi:hypothetical protein